jgi:hypothetical protein
MRAAIAFLLLLLTLTPTASAVPRPPAPLPTLRPEDAPASPILSNDTRWVRPVLITIGVLAAAALLLGPLYRLSLPSDLLPHSHDEPPGASHHHGPSGTVDFSAPDRR